MRKSDRIVLLLLVVVAMGCVVLLLVGEHYSGAADGMGKREREGDGVGECEGVRRVGGDEGGDGFEGFEEFEGFEGGEEFEGVEGFEGGQGKLMPFDPNTVDSITLLRYGLGPMQIRSLMGYRRHNGTFDRPLAVSKLYNWSDEDVDKVLPYIVIGERYRKSYRYRAQYERELRAEHGGRRGSSGNGTVDDGARVRRNGASNKFSSLTKIDLNVADTTLLMRVPGVGTGIANAIVRLRERLGGFYEVEQLGAIGYVSPELYEWFEVGDAPQLHLININRASFHVLNAHPYISYEQTRELMAYRRLYGMIRDREALLGTGIFTEKELERLERYLEY